MLTPPRSLRIIPLASSGRASGTYAAITPTGMIPDGRVNAASLAYDLAFYREQGLIKGTVDLGDVLDGSFVDAVLAEMGPYRP